MSQTYFYAEDRKKVRQFYSRSSIYLFNGTTKLFAVFDAKKVLKLTWADDALRDLKECHDLSNEMKFSKMRISGKEINCL